MKYLADTIVEYIWSEICDQQLRIKSGTFRFVLPGYSAQTLFKIGDGLKQLASKSRAITTTLSYGIAYELGNLWEQSSDAADYHYFEKIKTEKWYNESNNLTSLRNQMRTGQDECLIVLLAGYEYIHDKESLRDFFRLDQESVWNICLQKSFLSWIEKALVDELNPDDNQTEFEQIAEFFDVIYASGLSDLCTISSFLEGLDFKHVFTANEAFQIVLEDLNVFGLPNLTGIYRNKSREAMTRYVSSASNFMSYAMFLNRLDRRKYLERIKVYKEKNSEVSLNKEILGDFSDQADLLDALEQYILTSSKELVDNLVSADFTFLLDKILQYQIPRDRKKGIKSKKLEGKIPEVFLNAIWHSLGEMKKEWARKSHLVDSIKVNITSEIFRHDFESIDDGEQKIDSSDRAYEFLRILLGGLDEFLEERLFEIDQGDKMRPVITLDSQLLPSTPEELKFQYSSVAEPQLKFRVVIENESSCFEYEYDWSIPQNHHSRLLVDLYDWVNRKFYVNDNALPIFSAPYVTELFMAKDEEEAARLLQSCIASRNSAMVDLISWLGEEEKEEKNKLIALSHMYQKFISSCISSGFYKALKDNFHVLRQGYASVMNDYLAKSSQSTLGPLLFKAFLLLPDVSTQNNALWNEYLEGAVVTPLHPAMLEMMFHQSIYLCNFFTEQALNSLQSSSARAFSQKYFDRIVDLSRIQWPLYGILSDVNKNLNTNSQSFGYIHMFGEPTFESSRISTKILLEELADEDEEEIDDVGLFQQTRTSELMKQTIINYCDLYSFANDGLTIGAYCGGEIQPLIAGIDEYLRKTATERPGEKHTLQLIIFSDVVDDNSVLRWINAWKDRWQVAELSAGRRHYDNCEISIKYRVINRYDALEQFRKIMIQDEYDIFFFSDFIKSNASRFQVVENLNLPNDYQKFPIVEKVSSRLLGGGKETQRERILSNQRFQLNALHAEVMASLKLGNTQEKKHVVVSISDFDFWKSTIDVAHSISGWVVCIDPAIDEQLLKSRHNDGLYLREIIGFGTGVGSYGENNYTISTDQFSIADIERRVARVISGEIGILNQLEAQKISASLVKEAINVAGLSIMKATGPERYVRELVSNTLTRKILKKDSDAFCDEMISLDAFLHWFDEPMQNKRPDLLRMKANIVNGHFEMELQLIECKLAQQSSGYIEEARQQIESGLRDLVRKFKPRISSKPDDFERIDQRYWWMQLHRLISTKGNTTRAKYNETLIALERLSEGLFTVNWNSAIFAYWTDQETNIITEEQTLEYKLNNDVFPISVVTTGIGFIKEVTREISGHKFMNGHSVTYSTTHDSELYAKIIEEQPKKQLEDLGSLPEKNTVDKTDIKTITISKSQPISKVGFDRVLLGPGTKGGKDAYWEFGHPNLPNRHILVFGASGTGKTYLIQALMCELAKLDHNSLIVDYTAGFTNQQLEETVLSRLQPKQHVIRAHPLEINPFRKQINYIDDFAIEEDPATIASRVSGVFGEVYQLGDQQRSALYNAIRDGISRQGSQFNLHGLIDQLERIREEGGPVGSSAASVISKIQPFVDMNPFGKEQPDSWEHIFKDQESKVHIIQLMGFVKNAARLITEFSLVDLYWYYRSKGDQENPKIIILDEIQNLDHRLDSPLGQFLTEGRKFGISLILATQTLSNLEREERDRLFQASHKIFFRPADTEVRTFAQILASSTERKVDEWVKMLSSLERGECYSLGYAYNSRTQELEGNRYFRVKIKALEERFG